MWKAVVAPAAESDDPCGGRADVVGHGMAHVRGGGDAAAAAADSLARCGGCFFAPSVTH